MAQLKSTIIQGNLGVTNNIVASKIIKNGGTAEQILMADGSTQIISNLISDTGATSITVTGAGNAVTAASYDANTRQIILTKGTTFLTAADLEAAITVASDDVLRISSSNQLSTAYDNSAATTADCGGLAKGTNVNGWSLKQILDKLLYKYTAPSVGGITYTISQNNEYIGGTITVSKATITVSAGSVNPGITSSSLSWNGNTYTGNNAGTTITAFGSKTITFTMNYTWTSSSSATSFAAKSGTATVNLSGANENGSAKTLTKTTNSAAKYFDRSKYYWGGTSSASDTTYSTANNSNNTARTKLGSGTGTALTASLSNEVFTLVLPKAWGTTLSVYDGASNPVTGVFKNVGEVTINNVNDYAEPYIVWKGAAATGTIKYFFHIK